VSLPPHLAGPPPTWGVRVEQTTFADDRPIRVAPQRAKEVKIALCTGGHGEYQIDGDLVEATPYSVQLFRPDQQFGYRSRFLPVDGCTYYALSIDPELARDLTSGSSLHGVSGPAPARILMSACLALTTTQHEQCCHQIVGELLTHLARAQGTRTTSNPRPELTNALARARRHLERHFDQPVSLQQLADQAGLAPNYLNTLFRLHYGTPPRQYQMQLRLAKARALLVSSISSSQVAHFSDQAHLSRQFKRFTGTTPGRYRATAKTGSLNIVRSFKTGPTPSR
jgi:AraC-like DNA-binding protein